MPKSTKGASALGNPELKPICNLTPLSQSTKPRCRKGDLAIRLDKHFEGQIVEVGEYHGPIGPVEGGSAIFDAWEVFHSTYEPDWSYFCEDKNLLPIRPDDLEETETDELSLVKGEPA